MNEKGESNEYDSEEDEDDGAIRPPHGNDEEEEEDEEATENIITDHIQKMKLQNKAEVEGVDISQERDHRHHDVVGEEDEEDEEDVRTKIISVNELEQLFLDHAPEINGNTHHLR